MHEATGSAPGHAGLRYMPALDGLRAAAVIAVLLYHGDVSWASGGYFGVDAFFVLSGFLITSLLVAESNRTGRVDFKSFWIRRARRLLPAVVVMLAAVAVYASVIAEPIELRQLRKDAFATLAYFANWNQIFSEQSYFEAFAAPSPLKHTWSLAIEEQFYLLWPLAVFAFLRFRRVGRRALLLFSGFGVAASAIWMAVLYEPGTDPSRVYYGTDTRVQSLLVGAVLAMLLAPRGGKVPSRIRPALDKGALLAAGLLVGLWCTLSERDAWQYGGGFLLMALLVATVIASVTQPDSTSPLTAALSWRPLRAIGMISYGLYLWHWPIYVWLSPTRVDLDGASLLALRLAVTVVVATASYFIVERPIRRGALTGWSLRVASPTAAAALAIALVVTTSGNLPAAFKEISASELQVPAAAAATRAVQPDAPPPPKRVMLVGDSMATSMAPGVQHLADTGEFHFWDASVPGCGLATDTGDRWFDEWRGIEPKCIPGWRERWPSQVKAYDPDIVVGLFGAQDAFDRRFGDHVVKFDTPEGFELARTEMQGAIDTLSASGAHVVMLTTPYYVLGWPQKVEIDRSPLNEPWIDQYNLLLYEVAAANADRVTLLDLNQLLGPNDTWTDTVDGVEVRSFDRCHLSEAGADFVAKWLVRQVLGEPA
jgi:peptidoglycan/LPS O-acetylase OafA/YrhL/lysophospholipase L1-like esterase